MNLGNQLADLLGLRWPAVALAFRARLRPGLEHINAPAAAGCAYWWLAAEGHTFWMEAVAVYGLLGAAPSWAGPPAP